MNPPIESPPPFDTKLKESGGFFRHIFTFSSFTLLSRIFGQVRSTLFASLLGTSYLADIFYLAFKIPNLFRRIFAEGAMNSVFIPIFNQLKNQEINEISEINGDEKEVEKKNGNDEPPPVLSENDFYSLIFYTLGFVLLIFVSSTVFFAEEITRFLYIFIGKMNRLHFNQTQILIQIMMPYLALISFSSLFQSILQSKKNFAVPAATPVLFNLVMITFAVGLLYLPEKWVGQFFLKTHIFSLGDKHFFKALVLSISVVIGGMVQMFYPWWLIRKLNFIATFKVFWNNRKHPLLKKFFKLMLPIFFTSGIYQINVLLIDPLALSLEAGTVSFLFYSNRLLELPLGIIGVSIATVSLPMLAKTSSLKEEKKFYEIIERTINLLFLLLPPVLVISILYSEEIVSLLFKFGQFDQYSVKQTAACFFVHILSLPAIFFYRFITNIFFAKNDTKTPFYSAFISLVLSLGLTVTFIQFYPKASSIALASTLASYGVLVYLLIKLKASLAISLLPLIIQRLGYFIRWSALPILIAVAVYFIIKFGMSGNIARDIIESNFWWEKLFLILEITLTSTFFLLSYGYFLYYGKEAEIQKLWKKIKNKFRNKI